MKTKYIFRMLLVAVTLLLGANTVKATVFFDDQEGLASYHSYNFPFRTFDNANNGDKLLVTYVINPAEGWTPTYQLQLGNVTTVTVTESGTYEFTLDDHFFQNINTTDENNIATYLTPINVTVYKIELVAGEGGETPTQTSFTLTVSVDGETTTQDVEVGTELAGLLPTSPTKDGYTFMGWDGLPEDGNMPNRNITITAKFVPTPSGEILWEGYFDTGSWQKLFISENIFANIQAGDTLCVFGIVTSDTWQFEIHDGSGNNQKVYMNTLNAVIIVDEGMVSSLTTPVDEKYACLFGQNFIVTAITLKAKAAEIPTHTLTVDMGYQTTILQVAEGTALSTVLPTPMKEGHTFSGWDGLPDDGNMPTSDLTVTALFTVNSYTLTYMLNDEIYGTPEQVEYGAGISPMADPDAPEGFVFSGWEDEPTAMPAHNVVVKGYFREYTTLSVGETSYATYCPTRPLYFEGNENVKAYIAKAKSETMVKLVQVIGTVSAGTGLVLIGNTANAEALIQIVEEGDTYPENLLVGVTGEDFTAHSANQYVLVMKDDGVKFADTFAYPAIVPVGKAYLQAPEGSSRLLSFSFEGETTAIESVQALTTQRSEIYNLSGQRVKNLKKGLYIVNGKKVIIK